MANGNGGRDRRPPINLDEVAPQEEERVQARPGRLEYLEPSRRLSGQRVGPSKSSPNYGLVVISVLLSVSLMGVVLMQFYPSKASLSALYNQVNQDKSSISSLQTSLTNEKARVDNALSTMSTLPTKAQVDSILTDVTALKDDVGVLEGKVPTKAQVDSLTIKVGNLENTVAGIKLPDNSQIVSDIKALKDSVAVLRETVTKDSAALTSLAGVGSSISTIQTNLTSVQSSIGALQGSVSALSVKVANLESAVAAFQNTPPQKSHILSVSGGNIQFKIDSAGSYMVILKGYGVASAVAPAVSLGSIDFSFLEADAQQIITVHGTGRAGFTSGSDEVLGNTGGSYRTYWTQEFVGGTIRRSVSTAVYEITEVDVASQKITIAEPYDGPTAANVTYVIEYFSSSGKMCYTLGILPPTGGWKLGDVVTVTCTGASFSLASISEGVGD